VLEHAHFPDGETARCIAATFSQRTVTKTLIGVVGVPVVTLFNTILDDSIAASGIPAVVGTGVCVDLIAIITLFNTCLEDSIATSGSTAAIGTGICVDLITIITLFESILAAIAALLN
tara:strand:+ start:481 stop:834 length:354 start_codon:yes stop_codon:yes gene_type:complete